MKWIAGPLSYFLTDPEARRNVRALLKYVALLIVVVAVFSTLFHAIMLGVEGRRYSWITGVYWTLTVMSTLGFGDITFASDTGKVFSIIVLLVGTLLLIIMLPFAFIRYFYAPWLEAQIRLEAPREIAADTRGHVVICARDAITPGLTEWLRLSRIPYVLIEPDPVEAGRLFASGQPVITGERDSRQTFEAARAAAARAVLANDTDTSNTNITITVREVAPEADVIALAEQEDSIDILELSGARHVLPLKRWLGDQLAARVNALSARAHVIGSYRDLQIAEMPVHGTPYSGQTIRETGLRRDTGLNILGMWERGQFRPARPDHRLTDHCVPVVIGTRQQLARLDELLRGHDVNANPVLVIGGGKVGRAATRALKRRGIPVTVLERKEELRRRIGDAPDRLVIGDAADRDRLTEAGLHEAPSVLLTTNDDATNIYLAVYCRKLNPETKIVSRITHERNVEAIYRAGADFVLSYASLGARAISATILRRELVVLGEGIDLFSVHAPASLGGQTLASSAIGAKTGLTVIAIQAAGRLATAPGPDTPIGAGDELLMFGSPQQRQDFVAAFGNGEV